MTVTISSVVEGHGDVEALPVLVRRLLGERARHDVIVRRPHRLPRGRFDKDDHLVRAVRTQAAVADTGGGVLVLADGDGACPVDLAQSWKSSLVGVGAAVEVVVANVEFETWVLAGLPSLQNHRLISPDSSFVGDPDSVTNPKQALADLMTEPYRESVHQASFAAGIDLDLVASRSRSFRRLASAVAALAT